MPVPPRGEAGLSCEVCRGPAGSTPIWGAEMPAPPRGAGLIGGALVCVACDASTSPTQPPVEPGTHVPSNFGDCITCASLLETTRLRVAPNQHSAHGVMKLRISAPPSSASVLLEAHVRVLA